MLNKMKNPIVEVWGRMYRGYGNDHLAIIIKNSKRRQQLIKRDFTILMKKFLQNIDLDSIKAIIQYNNFDCSDKRIIEMLCQFSIDYNTVLTILNLLCNAGYKIGNCSFILIEYALEIKTNSMSNSNYIEYFYEILDMITSESDQNILGIDDARWEKLLKIAVSSDVMIFDALYNISKRNHNIDKFTLYALKKYGLKEIDMLILLLDRIKDVNYDDGIFLKMAVTKNDTYTIRALIERGANVYIDNRAIYNEVTSHKRKDITKLYRELNDEVSNGKVTPTKLKEYRTELQNIIINYNYIARLFNPKHVDLNITL